MNGKLAVVLAAAVMGSMLLATGCVSQQKYDEALAAARRANEQLGKAKNALRDLRVENQKLMEDLQQRDALLAAREKALTELQKTYDQLNQDFKDLYAKYQKAAEGAPPQPIGIHLLPTPVHKALEEFAKANPDLVEYFPKYGMVKFKSDLTFAPGSDDVAGSAKAALAKLVEIVNRPEAQEFNVYVAGHTDDMRIVRRETKMRHPTNWYLSVHRAVAVQEVLAEAGLAAGRTGVMGFSEYHPVAPNAANNGGNRLNRRVEIWIVPRDRFLTIAGG